MSLGETVTYVLEHTAFPFSFRFGAPLQRAKPEGKTLAAGFSAVLGNFRGQINKSIMPPIEVYRSDKLLK